MKKFTVKYANFLLSVYSYLRSSFSGSPKVVGMPVFIGVELTNNCNLNCPECSSGSGQMQRERGFMDIGLFNKILNELGPYIFNINLYFQGEPMLHPSFFSFLEKARNIHTIVSTNGHFLSVENAEKIVKSGLNQLTISLDGLDQESYSAYRVGGCVDTVIKGIENISDAKEKFDSSLKVVIQLLVNRLNEPQIAQIKAFAKKRKVSLKLKSMQIINKDDFEQWLPLNERFRRYKLINKEFVLKNPLPDRCARLWLNPVVTWDGKVIPCCFDKDAEYVMGDLNSDLFRDIWDGPRYRIFRKNILSGRHTIDICRNCTSGLRGVKY